MVKAGISTTPTVDAVDVANVHAHDQNPSLRLTSFIDDESDWSSKCGLVVVQGPLEKVQQLAAALEGKYRFKHKDAEAEAQQKPIIGDWPVAYLGATVDITHGRDDIGSVRIAGTPRIEDHTQQMLMDLDPNEPKIGQLRLAVPLGEIPRFTAAKAALDRGRMDLDYYPARDAVEAMVTAAEEAVRAEAQGLGIKCQKMDGKGPGIFM